MRNQDLSAQQQGGDHPRQPQALTIVEAAQVCGLSTSTIRRYLRGGRFPGARQDPSPVHGQPRHWRIPPTTSSKPARTGSGRHHPGMRRSTASSGLGRDLGRQRPCARAGAGAHPPAGCRGPGRRAGPHDPDAGGRAAGRGASSRRTGRRPGCDVHGSVLGSGGGQAPGPGRPPGVLQRVPRPRRSKGELSQEERAAIIGRALSGQRPPKRGWEWW
jgi:hypothetical protein